jgi:glycosyltransferase involved in cell wall biosynthesis
MIAYACDPRGGGEHWLGWGWVEQAAQNFAVDLITTPKAQPAIEQRAGELGVMPHFVPVSPSLRKVTESVGGNWLRKLAWQKRAAQLATSLHQQKKFALVHQTTFHTFRVPFLASGLGIPSVWGPLAGGERVPPGFGRYLGRARFAEFGRALLNRCWLQVPSVKRSLQDATVLFVSNHTTLNFLPPGCRHKCQVVPPNALRPEDEQAQLGVHPLEGSRTDTLKGGHRTVFHLLYVGNCVATRAVPLVLDALTDSGPDGYEFSIVGGGPALADWQENSRKAGLNGTVHFVGKVEYSQLAKFYAQADALVFPALRDSGGSALLEAMARGLPVICLDWGGPAEMVDEVSGIKIPVSTPRETVRAMAAALARLRENPGLCASLGAAARARALAVFSWPAKRGLLESTYRRLIRD